jgi:DNA-binding NarL/FixJ family response regulator
VIRVLSVDDHPLLRGGIAALIGNQTDMEVVAEACNGREALELFRKHNAPATQFVITLSGILEFATRSGETFTINPGEILIALDTTGTGHKWRLTNDRPDASEVLRSGAPPSTAIVSVAAPGTGLYNCAHGV